MSKLIIIEGCDNTGKDTQQNLIIKKLNDLVFQKLHYSSIPLKDSDAHIKYSSKLYDDMFKLMLFAKDNNINAIFNRSHIGETVYSPFYRGYSGDYVFDIESKYVNELKDDLYLITLVNDPEIILSRDDGKSYYQNTKDIEKEVTQFKRAHRQSKIKNKLLINIGTMDAESVSRLIMSFIVSISLGIDAESQELTNKES